MREIVPDYDPPMNLPGYQPDRTADARRNCEPVLDADPPEQEADHLRRRRHHRSPARRRT